MTQNGLERRIEKLENGHLDKTGQPIDTVVIYLPDNGRGPSHGPGKYGSVVIYDPQDPEKGR